MRKPISLTLKPILRAAIYIIIAALLLFLLASGSSSTTNIAIGTKCNTEETLYLSLEQGDNHILPYEIVAVAASMQRSSPNNEESYSEQLQMACMEVFGLRNGMIEKLLIKQFITEKNLLNASEQDVKKLLIVNETIAPSNTWLFLLIFISLIFALYFSFREDKIIPYPLIDSLQLDSKKADALKSKYRTLIIDLALIIATAIVFIGTYTHCQSTNGFSLLIQLVTGGKTSIFSEVNCETVASVSAAGLVASLGYVFPVVKSIYTDFN